MNNLNNPFRFLCEYNSGFPRRLWQQIFLILLGLMIVPLVILGSLLINNSQKTMEETVSRDLKQIALHATGEVVKEYVGAYQALDATASILGVLHAETWRQETAIVELSLKYPFLRHICSVDLTGNSIACSDLGQPMAQKTQIDLLDCARNQDHCISKVRIASDHMPVMDMAVPIRRYGKVEGMLIAEYNLRGIWDVVDQIQFGPQSYAILIDQDGHILAYPDKKKVLKNDIFSHPQVISELRQGQSDSRIELDPDQHKWIIAFSPIISLHWGLIIAQPYTEAFSFLRIWDYHSWILILFSVFAAALISFIIAQWMSQPVNEMIQATRRLAQGDLSVSLPIRRRDEINRLKHSFNHMTLELKKARQVERLSIVGKSAASIAHELKNSLVLIKTFVQLIPQRHKEKAFVKDATDTIAKELDSWNSMLRNMMDFAREQMPLELVVVNINEVVKEETYLAKLKMDQTVSFQVQIANENLLALADEPKIKQVVVNLIANAFEATPSGGEIVVRTFSAIDTKQNSVVGFEVTNSGEGIAPGNLERIFDPFFTTKETGLGLGLAICRDIVQKHNGHLEVVNQTGKMVTFRVLLPVFVDKVSIGKSYDFREDRSRG